MKNNSKLNELNHSHHRLAAEALLEEAKAGARRAAVVGPSGWIKKKDSINKKFLHSTMKNVISSNKYKTKNSKSAINNKSNDKEGQVSSSQKTQKK